MIEDLVDILHKGNHSLVVANGEIRTFDRRGVADLYGLLCNAPGFLKGAAIADKVVGKGAAALMILGQVSELHADIISEAALELFHGSPVKVSYGEKVPYIINRNGTGWCPVETLCRDSKSAEECLPLIQHFMNNLKK